MRRLISRSFLAKVWIIVGSKYPLSLFLNIYFVGSDLFGISNAWCCIWLFNSILSALRLCHFGGLFVAWFFSAYSYLYVLFLTQDDFYHRIFFVSESIWVTNMDLSCNFEPNKSCLHVWKEVSNMTRNLMLSSAVCWSSTNATLLVFRGNWPRYIPTFDIWFHLWNILRPSRRLLSRT